MNVQTEQDEICVSTRGLLSHEGMARTNTIVYLEWLWSQIEKQWKKVEKSIALQSMQSVSQSVHDVQKRLVLPSIDQSPLVSQTPEPQSVPDEILHDSVVLI